MESPAGSFSVVLDLTLNFSHSIPVHFGVTRGEPSWLLPLPGASSVLILPLSPVSPPFEMPSLTVPLPFPGHLIWSCCCPDRCLVRPLSLHIVLISIWISFLHWTMSLFIYLAASGLSGSTWDLHCSMWDVSLWDTNSLGVAQAQ